MNITVTGGAGFIGSHLIDKLLSDGHTVINIDNMDPFYGKEIKKKNIESHFEHKNYSFYESDIRDKKRLDEIISDETDVIVHLAAKAGVRPSIEDPIGYQEVNVKGTQNMLEVAKEKGIKQFIFASSSSVYGNNPNVPWKEDDSVLNPISPYASTKVSGELMGHVYSHLYNIRFIALRFFTVYGPRQRPDLAIHKFYNLISKGEKIQMFGDGSTRRDYTYIDDIISGIVSAINYKKTMFEVINLGNNNTVTLLELISSIESICGVNSKKTKLPEQPGDVRQTWASNNKSRKLLRFSPLRTLESGLNDFKLWFEIQKL